MSPQPDRPATGSDRHFVALVPPPDLGQRARALQREAVERYGSRAALRSPPHITLQPPFPWPRDRQAALDACLDRFAADREPFPVEIDGFGAFPPRVVFLQPRSSPALSALQRDLADRLAAELAIVDRHRGRPFRPHLTLAFRDLDRAGFARAWADWGDRPFRAEFWAGALALLCHDGRVWQVRRTVPLGDAPLEDAAARKPTGE